MQHIVRCTKCHTFTMKSVCACGGKAVTTQPPKYSPDDKYGKYRRQVLEKQRKEEGLM